MSDRDGKKNSPGSSPDKSGKRPIRRTQHSLSGAEQGNMPSQFNRVSVEALLNAEGSSSSRHQRSSHRRTTEGDKRHKGSSSGSDSPTSHSEIQCTVPHCKRKFPSGDALKAHMKRSHPAPTAYVCEHCKSSFSTPPNLNKHVSYFPSAHAPPHFSHVQLDALPPPL